MRDRTKIEAWRLADDLTVGIYEATRAFPKEELYGLASQLRRAAYSVPANIAEGSSREGKRDYREAGKLDAQTKSTFACLHGLIRAVEKETGKPGTVLATITSAPVLFLWSRSPWSVVPS